MRASRRVREISLILRSPPSLATPVHSANLNFPTPAALKTPAVRSVSACAAHGSAQLRQGLGTGAGSGLHSTTASCRVLYADYFRSDCVVRQCACRKYLHHRRRTCGNAQHGQRKYQHWAIRVVTATRTDRTCGNQVSRRDLDATQDSAQTFFAPRPISDHCATAGIWAAARMGDSRSAGRIRAVRDTHHNQDPKRLRTASWDSSCLLLLVRVRAVCRSTRSATDPTAPRPSAPPPSAHPPHARRPDVGQA